MRNKKNFLMLAGLLALVLVVSGCLGIGDKDTNTNQTANVNKTNVNMMEEVSTLDIEKVSYSAGDNIEVTYSVVEELGDGAWIGVVPTDTAHTENAADAVDTDYEYIKTAEGTADFSAPSEAGEYDVRIFSDDNTEAVELIYSSFEVVDMDTENMTLELDKEEYEAGEEITVTYSGTEDLSTSAWVGIIASSVEHGSEDVNDANDVDYEYLNGEAEGTATLMAPEEAGEYDVRLNSSDSASDAVELIYTSFEVVE